MTLYQRRSPQVLVVPMITVSYIPDVWVGGCFEDRFQVFVAYHLSLCGEESTYLCGT